MWISRCRKGIQDLQKEVHGGTPHADMISNFDSQANPMAKTSKEGETTAGWWHRTGSMLGAPVAQALDHAGGCGRCSPVPAEPRCAAQHRQRPGRPCPLPAGLWAGTAKLPTAATCRHRPRGSWAGPACRAAPAINTCLSAAIFRRGNRRKEAEVK